MDFTRLRTILLQARIPLLASLLPPDLECFLVGGALRDWQLGRPVSDFDFAVSGDPTTLAQRFAAAIGGHWFLLDAERRQSRVVTRQQDAPSFNYDFSLFRADDLIGDVHLRDFTINAVALPVVTGNELPALIDPLGGISHLRCGFLRGCSPGVFRDDPLRILKGVRHCATLGLSVEPRTLIWMREAANLLPRVAAERVRSELSGIFAADDAVKGMLLLRELGLLEALFGPDCRTVRFEQGLERLGRAGEVVDFLLSVDRPRWLDRKVEDNVSRRTLLKIAAFLSGLQLSNPQTFFAAWRFGRNTTRIGASLAGLSPQRFDELTTLASGRRGRALWSAGLGPGPCEHLAFLPVLSELPVELAVERILPLLDDVRATIQNGRIPDLVDGDWVRTELGLSGVAIGQVMQALRIAEIEGRVCSVESARAFLCNAGRREG